MCSKINWSGKYEGIRNINTGWNCENYLKKELSDIYRLTDYIRALKCSRL